MQVNSDHIADFGVECDSIWCSLQDDEFPDRLSVYTDVDEAMSNLSLGYPSDFAIEYDDLRENETAVVVDSAL